MAEFYRRYFSYQIHFIEGDRIVELRPEEGGLPLLLHPAGKSAKQGQVIVKLVFDVEDVEAFCQTCRQDRLEFGKIHTADGYQFANAKDPSKNSISVSSRAFAVQ